MIRDGNSNARKFHHKDKNNITKQFKRLEDLLFETLKKCKNDFDVEKQNNKEKGGLIEITSKNLNDIDKIFGKSNDVKANVPQNSKSQTNINQTITENLNEKEKHQVDENENENRDNL